MKRPEILAPAGDLEILKVAIEAGADAVYIGGKSFGARYFATNFSDKDIIEAVKFTHLRDKKIYVTVNTIVYESEFDSLKEYIDFLYNANVDAIIVQDMGVIKYVRENYPDFEVHVSTQMNVNSKNGLLNLKSLGIKRVVLARETSLDDIKGLTKLGIEIEAFVHGALCFSASGNCLMSYSIGKRSGNRGKCAQPCRKTYELFENDLSISKKSALLSMKDLCTIDYVNDLIESGIDSFKIEGRMKSREYVYSVVKNYKKAVDSYFNNEEIDTSILKEEMSSIFSRGYTKGYLLKEQNQNITNQLTVNHQGVRVGKIIRSTNSFIEIKLEKPLMIGDAIRINSKEDIGFVIQVMFKNGEKVKSANTNDVIKLLVNTKKPYPLVEVLLTKPKTIEKEIDEFLRKEQVKVPIYGKLTLKYNEKATFEVTDNKNIVKVETSPLKDYLISSKNNEFYIEKLNKTNDSIYYFKNIDIIDDKKVFISVKDLNDLRRRSLEILNDLRINSFTRTKNNLNLNNLNFNKLSPTIEAVVHNNDQYEVCKEFGIKTIYTDYLSDSMNLDRLNETIKENSLVHNLSQITKNVTLSSYFNIVNKNSIDLYKNLGVSKIYLSYETNLNELKNMNLNDLKINIGMPIYAKMDVMATKHCVIAKCKYANDKSCGKCINNNYYLQDEYQNKFDILTNPSNNCTIRIIDYKTFDIIDKIEMLKNNGINLFLLTFTTESIIDVRKILTKLINYTTDNMN